VGGIPELPVIWVAAVFDFQLIPGFGFSDTTRQDARIGCAKSYQTQRSRTVRLTAAPYKSSASYGLKTMTACGRFQQNSLKILELQ
jgi:hypothetical protein